MIITTHYQIRTQYHFRPSPHGLLAWDVRRLINQSCNLPIKNILLSAIQELDECFWYDGNNKPTCRNIVEHTKLIQAADLHYPIILCKDGRVMDGMHRVCKALLQGLTHINAVQFTIDIKPDFTGINPKDLPYD
ncbi:hypothetical protein [Piscirickettsia salmonis]|uniref:hypothetical protein n=1 Tax=Piscirickettsia salmonis TaxID=1238 RepID=UPI0007D75616|nr:hypothetical protein A0O36_01844 [Piscirickettsiaceae bacterium NZ-RLO1]